MILLEPGAAFAAFERTPTRPVSSHVNGLPCELGLGIEDYSRQIQAHYEFSSTTTPVCGYDATEFVHFGVCVAFDAPCEFSVEDSSGTLIDPIRWIVARYGAVFFKNLRLPKLLRERGHHAQFPQHRFHRDRAIHHENQYSVYTRDPDVPEQRAPRNASTLFISNAVMELQMARECQSFAREPVSAELFLREDFDSVSGRVVLEHRWDAPRGCAEVGIIDNRRVFHACRRREDAPCYSIGVMYLT